MLISTAAPDPEPGSPGPIVALVGQYTESHPSGGHQLRGACPFCRSTAFLVRPSHGTFHCLRCGEGGDARSFFAKINR